MPYYERWDKLQWTLETFVGSGYRGENIDVSLCDDGSTVEPIPLEWSWDEGIQIGISWLPKKPGWQNPCVPLNQAVRQSDGELVLLQSPETWHETPCAKIMREHIKDDKDVVLAHVKSLGYVEQKLWHAHPEHRPKRYWFCQMMTRKFYDEIGGFDEEYRNTVGYEDDDFEKRLTDAGANWIWCEDAIAVHEGKSKTGIGKKC